MKTFKRKKVSEKVTHVDDQEIETETALVGISFKKIEEDNAGIVDAQKEHCEDAAATCIDDNETNSEQNEDEVKTISDFVDENKPFTEGERKKLYKLKFSKNVMAGRRIREMMNANVRAELKKKFSVTQSYSEYKSKLIVGLAVTLQVIPIILIFI